MTGKKMDHRSGSLKGLHWGFGRSLGLDCLKNAATASRLDHMKPVPKGPLMEATMLLVMVASMAQLISGAEAARKQGTGKS